jgi:hypothetical protein
MSRKVTCTPVGCGVLVVLFIIGSIVNAFSPQDTYTPSTQPSHSITAEPSTDPTETATPEATPTPTATPTADATPANNTALALLGKLTVKARGPQTGYKREAKFGAAWIDVDGNGCDTRNDILRRDFEDIIREDGCTIKEGIIDDPYTGDTIHFVRGRGTSLAVQIDHIVALSDAWKTGATKWSQDKRIAFANDPLNLVAVDGPTNAAKGDDDAAWWLPPRRKVWCWYVAHQVSIKYEYGLWVTPDEKVAMTEVLTTCPTQKAYKSDYPEMVATGDLYTR